MELLTVKEIIKSLKEKKFTSEEITQYYLSKSLEDDKKGEKGINAFINVLSDNAINNAKDADKKIAKGENSALLGVPVAIKDNINIKGIETTCASKILKGYLAAFDAFVIEQLKNTGAVFTGKLNLDEFAMGSSNENSAYGPVRNPHDLTRIAGGSSGGAAAAVAADLIPAALGSDTGGSIRLPAGLCGVVGLKPTYGRVSRYGLVAYGSSLDQIGPVTRSVEDAALLLSIIAGHDKMDSTSVDKEKDDYLSEINNDIKGMKIGVPEEYFTKGLSKEVEKGVKKSIETLKDLGCEIVDINLPHTKYGVPVYYIIATSEASSNLARFDGIRYGVREKADDLLGTFMESREKGFGVEVKRRIMLGTYSLSSGYYDAYYLKALKVRTLIKNDFIGAFNKVDAILAPVSPTPAFKIGEKIDDPVEMYLTDIFTINANLSGVPGISVPVMKEENGLPVSIQFLGNHFNEKVILNIANKFSEAVEYDYRIKK